MAVDQTITCRDCAVEFVFSVREQEFFAERGFGAPVRCVACRRALKAKRQEGEPPAGSGPRQNGFGRPQEARPQEGRPQEGRPDNRPYGNRPSGDRPYGDRPRRDFSPRSGSRPPEPSRPGASSEQFPELQPNYRAEPAMAGGGGSDSGPRYRERSFFTPEYPKKRKKLNSGRPQVEDDGTGWEE